MVKLPNEWVNHLRDIEKGELIVDGPYSSRQRATEEALEMEGRYEYRHSTETDHDAEISRVVFLQDDIADLRWKLECEKEEEDLRKPSEASLDQKWHNGRVL
jgi:hypothetical protein